MVSPELKDLTKKANKSGSERVAALRRLHEICSDSENRMPLVNNFGILGICKNAIATDRGDARLLACKLLLRISLEDGTEYPIMSESGMMSALKDAALTGDTTTKENACNLISNLMYEKSTREPMVHDHGILPVIVRFSDFQMKHALTALQRLAFNGDLRATMIRENGVMELLNRVVHEDSEEFRELALDTIESLACDRNQCKPLVEKNALPILVKSVEMHHGKSQLLALKCLHRLSEGNYCEMTMQKFPNLINLLIKVFYDVPDSEQQKVILRTFWNLSSTNDVSLLMANQPLLELEMECLRSDDEDFNKYSSTFMFNLVYESEEWIKKRLKELRVQDSLMALLNKGDETAFKALCCIAILVGSEEKDSVIAAEPRLIEMFIDGLIQVTDTGSYLNGRWNKKNFLVPIQLLCVSDKNKPGFCKSRKLVNQLVDIMKSTLTSDPKAVALCVDILLQISFFYEDDETDDGAEKMLKLLDSGKPGMLKETIKKVMETTSFSHNVRQSAGNLHRALFTDQKAARITRAASSSVIKRPSAAPSAGGAASPSAGGAAPTKHVMISYSWKLNKDLVVQIASGLRRAGVEVWRDEEGSAVVGAMSGSVDDTMAAAVENSSDVIIFVSQAYKDSANCQAEARYANKLCKQKKLRLHFVMVDQEYMEPEGWLGIMLGDQLWHRCWTAAHVGEAVSKLATAVGKASPAAAAAAGAAAGAAAATAAAAAPEAAPHGSAASLPPPPPPRSVIVPSGRSWDEDKVGEWLKDTVGLPQCAGDFKKLKMTGASMEMLGKIEPSADELKKWMLILKVGTMGEMLHLMTHARSTFAS